MPGRSRRAAYRVLAALGVAGCLLLAGCTSSGLPGFSGASASPPAPASGSHAGSTVLVERTTRLAPVSTEQPYNAFPFTIRTARGTYVTTYGVQRAHLDPDSRFVVRLSNDALVWSAPIVPSGQSPEFGWGSAGIAAETAAQGGRTYLPVVRGTFGPEGVSTRRLTGFLTTSDDGGRTWTAFRRLPEPVPGWSFPQNAIVLTDGSVLLGMYTMDGEGRQKAYYYRSTDRGGSWQPAGIVGITDRDAAEPTFGQLPDGRVVSFLRSDGRTGQTDQLFLTVHSKRWTGADGWAAPFAVNKSASGMPSPIVLDDGYIVVLYRGFTNAPETPAGFPPVAMVVAPNLRASRVDIPLLAGDSRRFLYGNIVPAKGGFRVVLSLEQPGGNAAHIFSFGLRITLP